MEAYALLKNENWRSYSLKWAEQNKWMGAREADPAKWKYKNYGEDMQHVLFGDWQICFQTYLDLYFADKGYDYSAVLKGQTDTYHTKFGAPASDQKIARALEVMDYEVKSDATDYWWWADALYMVMPVMSKLYRLTGDEAYLDKMYANWQYANNIMYDNETGMYFRDGKYVFPKHATDNGIKDFWARGDGWVMAAFARILRDMPNSYKHREEFVQYYKRLAKAIVDCQQPEGYWTRSLLDPHQAPGRETSGTALNCFSLLWGINNGILSEKEYLPSALKAWEYLSMIALQPDLTVGYVQPIGEKAIPGQVVDKTSVANFGTGAFLLAGCEYVRLMENTRLSAVKKFNSNNKKKVKKLESKGFYVGVSTGVAN